jgi:hypothetical protein
MRLYLAALALALTPALSGCAEDKGSAAEKRYDMVKRNGTPDEQCAAATAVADTYLELGNEEKYKLWSLLARQECFANEMRRRLAS